VAQAAGLGRAARRKRRGAFANTPLPVAICHLRAMDHASFSVWQMVGTHWISLRRPLVLPRSPSAAAITAASLCCRYRLSPHRHRRPFLTRRTRGVLLVQRGT
jgi:hypothetical protein